MVSPSDYARRRPDLLSHAHGADLLNNEETIRLQQRARARKNKKVHFSILKMGGCYDALFEHNPWNEPRSSFSLCAASITGMRIICECGRIPVVGPVSSTSGQYRTSRSQTCHAFRLRKTWNGCDQEHTRLVLPDVKLPLKMNQSQQSLVNRRGHYHPLQNSRNKQDPQLPLLDVRDYEADSVCPFRLLLLQKDLELVPAQVIHQESQDSEHRWRKGSARDKHGRAWKTRSSNSWTIGGKVRPSNN